jgi:flagellar motor switch protein FliG
MEIPVKKRIGAVLLACLFAVKGPLCILAAEDAPDPLALEQERRLKDDTERQAQSICDSILGKGSSSVLVNVELGLESLKKGGSNVNRKLDNKSGGLGEDSYLLPWVPAPKSVTKEEVPKDANVETQAAQQASVDVKTVLKRFEITVVHDQAIPAERVKFAQDSLASAFERYKNILKIYFRATPFLREGGFNAKEAVTKNLWDFFKPQHIILLLLLLLAMMLLKFFFGPLADFMKSYIEGMKEQSKSKVEMENTSETENETDENADLDENGEATEGVLSPEEQAAMELAAQEEAMQKFIPFTYVTDENIKQLSYLLHHEEPWVVALVISYLTPAHALKVMEAMPADLQAKVALETAMYRQTSMEQVVAINEDIKEKIDFVVGGLEKLIGILENSDRFSRDNILEYLKNEKPSIYERVRESILLFDDIANFPKNAMQVVVRELKTDELARALRGTSPELQQKFYDNMSQGAVTLLKEEMQYGRPATDDQTEEERKKIVDLIKGMEKDGKISFRQKGKNTAITGDEMGSDMPPLRARSAMGVTAENPEAAEAAYQAGLQANEAGNIEEAVQQFEQAVQLNPTSAPAQQSLAGAYYGVGRYAEAVAVYDAYLSLEPNPELQAWVEELRASLSAPAS